MFAQTRRLVIGAAAAALLGIAGTTAPAQSQPAQDSPDAPASDTVGPPQLRGFELAPSKPTAPADTPPDAVVTPPPPVTRPADQVQSQPAKAAPASPSGEQQATTGAPAPRPTGGQPAATAEAPRDATTPADTAPATTYTPAAPTGSAPGATAEPIAPGTPIQAPPAPASGWSFSWIYLLIALAAAMGAFAAIRFLRIRGEAQRATPDYGALLVPTAEPAPRPVPAPQRPPAPTPAPLAAGTVPAGRPMPATPPASAPQPVPAAAAPTTLNRAIPRPTPAPADGLVALQMRPWLKLEFKPDRAAATLTEAAVQYELVISNVGNAVAQNVRIEARMFNAGRDQDRELSDFFASPIDTRSGRVLAIPARSAARLRQVVAMPKEEVREITIEGRRLFIPLVAFNVVYEWGNGKSGQTSMSYLVGRQPDTPTDKMGAFRLDLGPRVYRSVGQRATEVAVLV